MLYDSHAHLISDDLARYKPSPLTPGTAGPEILEDANTAEKFLRRMDANKVERAVAVQRAHIYGYDNSYTVDACAQYPDRLRAVVVVNAQDAHVGNQIRHWVDRGAVGIRLAPASRDQKDIDWLASEAARAAWEEAAKANISVCVHMFPQLRTGALAAIAHYAKVYPKLKIVIDHLTNLVADAPDNGCDDALKSLVPHKNVFLKFTTINQHKFEAVHVAPRAVMKRVYDLFGVERLVWGSDLGQSKGSYEEMVAIAHDMVADFSDTEKHQALYENTRRFYGP